MYNVLPHQKNTRTSSNTLLVASTCICAWWYSECIYKWHMMKNSASRKFRKFPLHLLCKHTQIPSHFAASFEDTCTCKIKESEWWQHKNALKVTCILYICIHTCTCIKRQLLPVILVTNTAESRCGYVTTCYTYYHTPLQCEGGWLTVSYAPSTNSCIL